MGGWRGRPGAAAGRVQPGSGVTAWRRRVTTACDCEATSSRQTAWRAPPRASAAAREPWGQRPRPAQPARPACEVGRRAVRVGPGRRRLACVGLRGEPTNVAMKPIGLSGGQIGLSGGQIELVTSCPAARSARAAWPRPTDSARGAGGVHV